MTRYYFYCFLVTTLFITSCKSDEKEKITYDLEGRWEVYEALRNNSITNTLEDGYFIFEDSTMKTNIVGTEVGGSFNLTGNRFHHKSALPVDYIINYYDIDTLHLNTEIRGFQFDFKLFKVKDTIPENLEL